MTDSFWNALSTPAGARERTTLEGRRDRAEAARTSITGSTKQYLDLLIGARKSVDEISFRTGYAYRNTPAATASDRKTPPKADRPPVTRIITPRGAALRFHILALAEVQMTTRAGISPNNARPLRPRSDEKGWTDLYASSAQDASQGKTSMTPQDKRLRQITGALDALEKARLIRLPYKQRPKNKYEHFQLLDETASRQAHEEPLPYTVPKKSEQTFGLPIEFITNGWVHVLEDSEIAVLMMTACRIGTIESGLAAIPAGIRVRHYGLGPDTFEAHRMLQRFGLLDVFEVGRNPDGTAYAFDDEGPRLHRLALVRDGFKADALNQVLKGINERLDQA